MRQVSENTAAITSSIVEAVASDRPGDVLNEASPPPAASAGGVLAQARADCVRIGLSPLQYANLLLPEALLAMMVHGLSQEDCAAQFQRFLDETLARWYAMASGAKERCDCARDHTRELEAMGRSAPETQDAVHSNARRTAIGPAAAPGGR